MGTGTRTVLLVDDDEDFRLQQKLMLENAGYRVVEAANRPEGEALLEKEKPDAAIVDLMMEEVDDGFALCYHIKKSKGIPVIMVTGVTAETGYEFESGTDEERNWIKADAVLAKPVRAEQLLGEIKRLLKD
jgi:two-component system, OmpR family, response regulator